MSTQTADLEAVNLSKDDKSKQSGDDSISDLRSADLENHSKVMGDKEQNDAKTTDRPILVIDTNVLIKHSNLQELMLKYELYTVPQVVKEVRDPNAILHSIGLY